MRYLNWPQKLLYDLNVRRGKRLPLKLEFSGYEDGHSYQNPIGQASSFANPGMDQLYEEQPSIGTYPATAPQYELPEGVIEVSPGLHGSPPMEFSVHELEAEALPGGGPEHLDGADSLEIEEAISEASQVPSGNYGLQMGTETVSDAAPGQEGVPQQQGDGVAESAPDSQLMDGTVAADEPGLEAALQGPMLNDPMEMGLEQMVDDPYLNLLYRPLFGPFNPLGPGPFGP